MYVMIAFFMAMLVMGFVTQNRLSLERATIAADNFQDAQMKEQRAREKSLIDRYQAFDDAATSDYSPHSLQGYWYDSKNKRLLHISESRQAEYRWARHSQCLEKSNTRFVTSHGGEKISLRDRRQQTRGDRFHYVLDDQNHLNTEEIFTNFNGPSVTYESLIRFDAEDMLCEGQRFRRD